MEAIRGWRGVPALMLLIGMGQAGAAVTPIDLDGPVSNWDVIMQGENFDPGGDTQANSNSSIDLVGTADDATLYTIYDNQGTAATTDDEVAFRIRVGGEKSAGEFSGNLWIGVDVDLDDDLDVFINLEGSGTPIAGTLNVYEAGATANISPSTSSVANPVKLLDLSDGVNYSFDAVDGSTDPDATSNDLNGDLKVDNFVSFKVSWQLLSGTINTLPLTDASGDLIGTINGNEGLTKDTVLAFTLSSSTQSNNVNGDVAGYDGNSDYSVTYGDQGGITPPQTFENLFPVFSDGDTDSVDVNEGTTAVKTLVASDANGDSLSYSVTGGADAALFEVDAGGNLSFKVAPVYGVDNSYEVTVQVSDGKGGTDTQTITVNVLQVITDTTAPVLGSVVRYAPSEQVTNADSLIFLVSFDEAVQYLDSADFETVGVSGTVSSVSANSASEYLITVTGISDANGSLGLALAAGQDIADLNGNGSATGAANPNESYILDNLAPATLTFDQDGQTFIYNTPTLSGSTEANAQVTLSINGSDYPTTADGSGNWSVVVSALSEGDYPVVIVASDAAGNELQIGGDIEIYLGNDRDNDGIGDDVEGCSLPADDFDNDGLANCEDTDSDNDGIDDQDEGNQDSDDDGAPDYLDSDSDNDGLSDSQECPSGAPCPDSDGDGQADYVDPDDDGDGINTVDEDADGNGDPADDDKDGDSIPNYLDEDSDGDGIYDQVEGNVHSDGDGVPDYLDENSDNDTIDDRNECPAGDTGEVGSGPCPDSDNDGKADYRDNDSDNDGLSDSQECPSGVPCPDSDGDGQADYVDPDDDGDGISTVDEDVNGNGDPIDDDTDGDGTPDYLDTDDDGDGISTESEGRSDGDGDGVANYLDVDQPSAGAGRQPGNINTGVSGAGSNTVFMMLLVAVAGLLRRFGAALLVVLPGVSLAALDDAYLGAGAGVSYLEPSVSEAGYELDDKTDTSWVLLAGYQLFPHWAAEGFYTDLGEATLNAKVAGVTPVENAVDYSFWGVSALYFLKGYQPGETGLDGLLRLGVGSLDGQAGGQTRTDQEHETQLFFGAGGEWRFSHGWAARGELQFYDRDAGQLLFSLIKRFGQPGQALEEAATETVVASTPEEVVAAPQDSDQDGVSDGQDQCANTAPDVTVDANGCELVVDGDGDGVPDSDDLCPNSAAGEAVNEQGCGVAFLKDAQEILFASNSAQLTASGQAAVDSLAEQLQGSSLALIVEAHTDSMGAASYNQQLSEKRAEAVVQALVEKGVDASRLTAKGMGESAPVADNVSAEGRKKNRRVEFKPNKTAQ